MLNSINNFLNTIITPFNKPLLFDNKFNLLNSKDENEVYIRTPFKPFLTLTLNKEEKYKLLQEIESLHKTISSLLQKNKIALLVQREDNKKVNIFIVRLVPPIKEISNNNIWKKKRL